MRKKKKYPRLRVRRKKLKSGKIWTGYYYDGRDEHGNRKEFPLGTDEHEALKKWAELELKPNLAPKDTLERVFVEYEKKVIPTLAPRTQKDYIVQLGFLRKVFSEAPINSLTPRSVAMYRDGRGEKAPIRANREISLLRSIYNYAREWGMCTIQNPCTGVKKLKETPRDYYAEDDVWQAVLEQGCIVAKTSLELAYLTGQRPTDTRRMYKGQIRNLELVLKQGKTGKKLRFALTHPAPEIGPPAPNRLGEIVLYAPNGRFIVDESGEEVSAKTMQNRFSKARAKAAEIALEAGNEDLAARIQQFQFRDTRAKTVSDSDTIEEAQARAGHTDSRITKRVYERKGQRVKPLK